MRSPPANQCSAENRTRVLWPLSNLIFALRTFPSLWPALLADPRSSAYVHQNPADNGLVITVERPRTTPARRCQRNKPMTTDRNSRSVGSCRTVLVRIALFCTANKSKMLILANHSSCYDISSHTTRSVTGIAWCSQCQCERQESNGEVVDGLSIVTDCRGLSIANAHQEQQATAIGNSDSQPKTASHPKHFQKVKGERGKKPNSIPSHHQIVSD